MADWARSHGTGTVFIDSGSTWQNARIESFNGSSRDELLNGWQFDSLLEARVQIGDWRIDDSTNRPHSALDQLHPTEFATAWTTRPQPQPPQQLDHLPGPSHVVMAKLPVFWLVSHQLWRGIDVETPAPGPPFCATSLSIAGAM